MSNVIEIEVDGPRNECLVFRPLQRRLRGRFDLNRVAEPLAAMRRTQWPDVIPGKRLGVDTETREAYIAEPLHSPEHAATRERIEARGMRLPPERETFPDVDLPTWLTYMKQAVDAGVARVTTGELPAKIEGKPRRSFIIAPAEPDPRDQLLEKLVAAFYCLMPPEKRAEAMQLLHGAE